MSTKIGFSDIECKIILEQIERRAKYRKEFLKARSDPCKHSTESYFVFDEAIQRFLSMKATQLEHFQVNARTIRAGVFMMVLPMFAYGYAVWTTRQKWLREISCGRIKYKDRLFKLK